MDMRVYLTVVVTIAWVAILAGAVIKLKSSGQDAMAWFEVAGAGLIAAVSCFALVIEPPLGLVEPVEQVGRRAYYPQWLDVWMRWKYVPVYAGYVTFAVGYLGEILKKHQDKS